MNSDRRNLWIGSILLSLCATAPLLAGSNALPSLDVSATATEITVRGGQPRGKILIVGYARSHARFVSRSQRHRAFISADGAGGVTLKPDGGVGPDSVWIAVDVQSGRYGTIVPASSALRQSSLSESSLRRHDRQPGKKLSSALSLGYFILVRPGEGAWELDAGDGSGPDGDGIVDGRMELSIDAFKAVAARTAAPAQFVRGDLLIAFSPQQAAFSLLQLDSEGGVR